MQATLFLVLANSEPAQMKKLFLDRFPVVLGRGTDSHICIADQWVSRRHCAIAEQEGTLVVEDLNTANGTFVNGCQVQSAPLMPGDHFTLGTHVFRITYERTSLQPPPPIVYSDQRQAVRQLDDSTEHLSETTFQGQADKDHGFKSAW